MVSLSRLSVTRNELKKTLPLVRFFGSFLNMLYGIIMDTTN